ncbi:hypothetical protein PMAN_a3722 [Pseudoalteromonas marina]|nr:hypothetical protein PMAN_a3722 [Pseudoalteromonas marina]
MDLEKDGVKRRITSKCRKTGIKKPASMVLAHLTGLLIQFEIIL